MTISFFDTLFLSHLVGDYLLQNGWHAMNKFEGRFFNKALIAHCALYTLSCAPAILYWGASPLWLLLIFGSHMIIDRRWPVVTFLKWKEGKLHDPDFEPLFWLVIVVDQIFHLFVLAAIALAC